MKQKEIIIIPVLIISILTACGQQTTLKTDDLKIQNKADTGLLDYPAASVYDRALAQGINNFAYDMSDRLAESGENYFFSPYSICEAISVLDNAAQGETKGQMEQLLGISDLMDWNMQMELFRETTQNKEALLTSANSIWVDKGFELSDRLYESYLPTVENYYHTSMYQADFNKDPANVKKQMDQWVVENTGGMIDGCGKIPDANTVLSLMNAVYFYGEWKWPFEAGSGYKRMFYGTKEDNKVEVMFQHDLCLHYYADDGLRGISLPYGDGSRVMNILITSKDGGNMTKGFEQTAAEIFFALSTEKKDNFLNMLLTGDEKMIHSVRMPKFEMEYSISQMKDLLRDMGMEDAFDEGQAAFPGIGEIYVTDIGHQAKIEVDELGSRAAALTEIGTEAAAEEPEMESINFFVDQPFLFMIQDTETGIILFMGQVNNLND